MRLHRMDVLRVSSCVVPLRGPPARNRRSGRSCSRASATQCHHRWSRPSHGIRRSARQSWHPGDHAPMPNWTFGAGQTGYRRSGSAGPLDGRQYWQAHWFIPPSSSRWQEHPNTAVRRKTQDQLCGRPRLVRGPSR